MQMCMLLGHQAIFIQMEVLMTEFVNQVTVMQGSVLTKVDEFGLVKLGFQEGFGDIGREEVEQYAHA